MENGKKAEPAATEVETVIEEPLLGPVLPEAETEDDPYNLPITHEVTLEGAPFFLPLSFKRFCQVLDLEIGCLLKYTKCLAPSLTKYLGLSRIIRRFLTAMHESFTTEQAKFESDLQHPSRQVSPSSKL